MPDVSVTIPSNSIRLSVPTAVSLSAQTATSQQPSVASGVAHTVILEPTPVGEVAGLSSGRLVNVENFGLAIKDELRNKVLSVERVFISATRVGHAKNMALRVDNIPTSLNAVTMPKNATILSASITSKTSIGSPYEIKLIDRNETTLSSIQVPSGATAISQSGLNVDLDEGETLKIFLASEEPVENPMVSIEFAWRAI